MEAAAWCVWSASGPTTTGTRTLPASHRGVVGCRQRGGRLGSDRPRLSHGRGRCDRGLVCEQASAARGSGDVAGTGEYARRRRLIAPESYLSRPPRRFKHGLQRKHENPLANPCPPSRAREFPVSISPGGGRSADALAIPGFRSKAESVPAETTIGVCQCGEVPPANVGSATRTDGAPIARCASSPRRQRRSTSSHRAPTTRGFEFTLETPRRWAAFPWLRQAVSGRHAPR